MPGLFPRNASEAYSVDVYEINEMKQDAGRTGCNHMVSLYSCELSGTLPNAYAELVELKNVQMAGNKITGTLPAVWEALVHMQYLKLPMPFDNEP